MGFLDETGAIARDRIFAVGMLQMHNVADVLRGIQRLRDRFHHHAEFRFSGVRRGALPIHKQFVDTVLGQSHVEFHCFVRDNERANPIGRFGTHRRPTADCGPMVHSPFLQWGPAAGRASLMVLELMRVNAEGRLLTEHIVSRQGR